jgi:protein-disulfide isomerase
MRIVEFKKRGRRDQMFKKSVIGALFLFFLGLFLTQEGFVQEDKIVQLAIETVRTQMRLPKGMEVRFVEKKESPIPEFYSMKLILLAQDREIPVVIYVDKTGEKIILAFPPGGLFIKGENVTRKEAGEPRPRKIDLGELEIAKSPSRGAADAKVTIVEFSNFQCSFCLKSWMKVKELIEKHPQTVKYVFKHFPLPNLEKSFELGEIAAATQEVSPEAFWVVHDFFFSTEGQDLAKEEKGKIVQRIEQILKEKGYDVKAFQVALETGKGKKRVEEDMAAGGKVPVTGTPTVIVNGDFIRAGITDKVIEQYMGK